MKQRILMITGWGGGEQLLNPLKQSLEQRGYQVELSNIFNVLDEEQLAQFVQHAAQFDVIAGWSLGGELAIVLAHEVFKQTGEAKTLITMASNPCFVATDNWKHAMSADDFIQFRQSFNIDPVATLKRFGLLVTKGVTTAKSDFNKMQSLLHAQPMSLLKQGLDMLEQLNLVNILKNYIGHQLHLFAEHDALVPYQVSYDMQKIAAKFIQVVELKNTAHSFPFVQVELTCQELIHFMESSV
ncbi:MULTISPECIES: hydrolase [unclassified Acinetobacter]|uniref:hydrolase n=1 Tax=unclassified Acinetobacter TaxID=196816 RepID=UPI00190A3284|nr:MULTISPECIES: hydrolase [unclassified Acinetobacter]MBK0064908.1 hydrolase [Acinetobacter sp. S55]MBK0068269.1 hydrolase [Acinetobacter sp. S54]